MVDKTIEIHTTCTKSQLSDISGLDSEHVSMDVLAKVHKLKTGTDMSDDPRINLIQREQAIAWAKRHKPEVENLFKNDSS